MKKISFLVLFIFLLNLQAEDLSGLLQELNDSNEMYHKTKVESAGTLILYTRDDMERMQINTLRDILRSLRFFTYKEGYVGEAALSPSGATSVVSSMFRLYIDDHEVSSPIYGSSMLQFADLHLGFADHVEIYEGGNAISFGNEPGLITIRIYSKNPAKEKGSTISAFGNSIGGGVGEVCYTQTIDKKKQSLLVYAMSGKTDRKKVHNKGNTYSKDSTRDTFYTKYNFRDKGSIALGYFAKKKDAFVGVGMAHTPINPNNVDRKQLFVNLKYPLPHAFNLNLSLDTIQNRLLFSDKNKIRVVQNPKPFTYFDGKFDEMVLKSELKQNIKHKQGNFIWGLQGIYKSYDIKHMLMDGKNFTAQSGPTDLKILSAYAQESFNINENNLLIGTMKLDNYSDDFNSGSHTESMARFGYIHLFSPTLSSKLFISKTYLYPGFAYTSTFPNIYFSNPSLGAEHYDNYVGELKYATKDNSASIGGTFTVSKDKILFDGNSHKFINNNQKVKTARVYAKYKHFFTPLDRISAEIYNTYFIGDGIVKKSPMSGAYIRTIDTVGRFDIFNELIYRSSYVYPLPAFMGGPIKIKRGYDYNIGIKWNVNHAFTLSLKGENIFGKASKTPIYGLGGVDSLSRRVIVGVRYFF